MKAPLLRRLLALGLGGLCVFAVIACSNSKKEDEAYKSAKALPPLEVPPDLINPPKDAGTAIPEPPHGTPAPASEAPPSNPAVAAVQAASTTPGIHIVKEGARRWLVVPAPADRVRLRVKDFLEQKGFTIAKEDPAAGIVETDWRGGGEEMAGDDLNAALKSGLRDKYTLLVEPGAVAGTSEVTVSHLGLQRQTAVDGKPVWQPRVSDPILEAELLDGLRAFLANGGTAAEPANALPAVKARLRTDNRGLATLTVGEDFERAWWRVGMSLGRSGFAVDDRNRSEGVYLIRLGTAFKEDTGLVSRLFGSNDGDADKQYRIVMKESGGETAVTVQYSGGGPVTVSTGERILEKIKDALSNDSTFRDSGKRQSGERGADRGRSHPDTD